MSRFINLIGKRFGRLVVTKFLGRKNFHTYWVAKCDCGNFSSVSSCNLRGKHSKSCGCLNKQKTRARSLIHGKSKTRTYITWAEMRNRCENPGNVSYKYYGAKGIGVCKRWDKFENFYNDMGEKPVGKWIDRIDNRKGYSSDNCRWATPTEQQNNRTSNRHLTFDGKTKTMAEWGRELGMTRQTISSRLNRSKWPVEKALTK